MANVTSHFHSDNMYCSNETSNGHVNAKIFTCDLLSIVQNIISGIASITPLTNNANAWKIEGEKGKPIVTIQYAAAPVEQQLYDLNIERHKQWESYTLENRNQQNNRNSNCNSTVLSSHSAISDLCKSNGFNTHHSTDETPSVATILHEAITGTALVVSDQSASDKAVLDSSSGNVFEQKSAHKKSPESSSEVQPIVNPDKPVDINKFSHQGLIPKRLNKEGNIQFVHERGGKSHAFVPCKSAPDASNSVPCKLCDKSKSCISFRAVHDEPHTGQKPFRCSYCPKRFAHGAMLINHEHIHTVDRPFSCIYCPKSFTRKNVLEIHKRIHTGEKPYKCSFCSKTFSIKHHKVNHERSHTGEKPFACSYCSKMFSRKSSLKQHESLHVRDTNPYVTYPFPKGFNGT